MPDLGMKSIKPHEIDLNGWTGILATDKIFHSRQDILVYQETLYTDGLKDFSPVLWGLWKMQVQGQGSAEEELSGLMLKSGYVNCAKNIQDMENVICSMSSVGRIISERKFPDARKRRQRKITAWAQSTILRKRRPKGLNISKPGEYVQMDSIILHHNGRKRTIITAIDMATRVGFGQLYKTPHAKAAWETLERFQELLRTKIRAVHTDNGSEFPGIFHENCVRLKISHTFSHPRTPKHHPHIERFNRTLQDEGIQPVHLSLPLAQIREELSAFLTNYNLFRPHESLHDLTPFRYYMQKKYPKISSPQLFNMYWTNTRI